MNPDRAAGEICLWIKYKLKEKKARGVVFGLSGGVDSSTLAILAKKSLGRKYLALYMPIEPEEREMKEIKSFCKKFKIRLKVIDLTEVYKAFLDLLPRTGEKTKGNLKARLRMVTLYYFANKKKYLVLGTGNKSEILVGYFTKYGDAGVDLLPLGNLYKTQVIELAKYLKIPRKILSREPSAGLWKGQTDKKELGMDYARLDKALQRIEKNTYSPFDKDVKRVKKMVIKSEHKRKLPEICKPD